MKKATSFLGRILCVILVVCMLSTTFIASAEDYHSYQERIGQGKISSMVKQKAVFTAEKLIQGKDLQIVGDFIPRDICVNNGKIYILDSGTSQIIVLTSDYNLERVIPQITYEGAALSLETAEGVYVNESETVYIADPESQKVYIADANGNVFKTLVKPESAIVPEELEFKARKIIQDKDGYLFVLCRGVYYGAMVFDKNYEFCGFFGSNQTTSSLLSTIKYFFKKFIQTDTQRENSLRALPYEFDDLYEHDGFVYTATAVAEGEGQIRKLSYSGVNILHHEGDSGDSFKFGNAQTITMFNKEQKTEKFVALAVDESGYIYALDQTYGRVFVYNTACELITAFGGGMGLGVQEGAFTEASEIAINGKDIIVLDSATSSFTVFKLTDFGKKLYSTIEIYNTGDYEAAYQLWQEILAEDAYNQTAYSGMANYYIAKQEYKTALEYAEKGLDRELYERAFEQVRREFLSDNFIWIAVICVIIFAAIVAYLVYRKKHPKEEKDDLGYAVTSLTSFLHPIRTATFIRTSRLRNEKKKLNIYTAIAVGIMVLMFIGKVLETTAGGFMYVSYNPDKYNSGLIFISTTCLALLFAVVNWGACTLFEGKGTLKEIIISTGFAMIPQVIYSIFFIIASHCLVYSEQTAISLVSTLCWLITIVVLLVQLTVIHDYSFFRAMGMGIVTLIGMALAGFLILLGLTMFQDVLEFFRTIFSEIMYRS